MSYATLTEIERELLGLEILADGHFKAGDIEDIIDEESEVINFKINNRYATPILEGVSPRSFLILKRITIYFVAFRVAEILNTKTQVLNIPSNVDPLKLELDIATKKKEAVMMLKSLNEGKTKLIDALDALGGREVRHSF